MLKRLMKELRANWPLRSRTCVRYLTKVKYTKGVLRCPVCDFISETIGPLFGCRCEMALLAVLQRSLCKSCITHLVPAALASQLHACWASNLAQQSPEDVLYSQGSPITAYSSVIAAVLGPDRGRSVIILLRHEPST